MDTQTNDAVIPNGVHEGKVKILPSKVLEQPDTDQVVHGTSLVPQPAENQELSTCSLATNGDDEMKVLVEGLDKALLRLGFENGGKGFNCSEMVRELHYSIGLLLESESHVIICNETLQAELQRVTTVEAAVTARLAQMLHERFEEQQPPPGGTHGAGAANVANCGGATTPARRSPHNRAAAPEAVDAAVEAKLQEDNNNREEEMAQLLAKVLEVEEENRRYRIKIEKLEKKLNYYEGHGGPLERLREAEALARRRDRDAQTREAALQALLRDRHAQLQALTEERRRLLAAGARPRRAPIPPPPRMVPPGRAGKPGGGDAAALAEDAATAADAAAGSPRGNGNDSDSNSSPLSPKDVTQGKDRWLTDLSEVCLDYIRVAEDGTDPDATPPPPDDGSDEGGSLTPPDGDGGSVSPSLRPADSEQNGGEESPTSPRGEVLGGRRRRYSARPRLPAIDENEMHDTAPPLGAGADGTLPSPGGLRLFTNLGAATAAAAAAGLNGRAAGSPGTGPPSPRGDAGWGIPYSATGSGAVPERAEYLLL